MLVKFVLILTFSYYITAKPFTKEVLDYIKQKEEKLKENSVYFFLSGLLNNPSILNSKSMIDCLTPFSLTEVDKQRLVDTMDLISMEANTLVGSNVYSHLKHKFKVCDINNDKSQRLSVYFIEKFRNSLTTLFFNHILNLARHSLTCFKKATDHVYDPLVEEYFINLHRYAKGYPDTFCQLKEMIIYMIELRVIRSQEGDIKFFYFGKRLRTILDLMRQFRRKCLNLHYNKQIFLDASGYREKVIEVDGL